MATDITVQELKARIDEGKAPVMIDVREPHEWDAGHLAGVKKISLGTLPAKITEDELAALKDEEVVLICRSGGRSGRATQFLRNQGFANARNMIGGMMEWQASIDPSFQIG